MLRPGECARVRKWMGFYEKVKSKMRKATLIIISVVLIIIMGYFFTMDLRIME